MISENTEQVYGKEQRESCGCARSPDYPAQQDVQDGPLSLPIRLLEMAETTRGLGSAFDGHARLYVEAAEALERIRRLALAGEGPMFDLILGVIDGERIDGKL